MKPLVRNIFLAFGIVALVVMVLCFPDGWETVRANRRGVVVFLPAILGIWAVVYALYSWSFQIIVNGSDHDKHLSFRHSVKLTLSAFGFTAVTPFGFGGGPYRVMELAKYIGMPRSISSVALYSMMHILSHFVLWTIGCVVLAVGYRESMTPFLWGLVGTYLVVFVAVWAFFNYSYKYGILCKLFHIFFYIPFLRNWSRKFYERNYEGFQTTDANIRYLYEHPRQLWGSLVIEVAGRLVTSFEFYFILLAFGIPGATFVDALIILCFSSFIGNILFLLPLQIGAREGSLAVIFPFLFPSLSTAAVGIGIYTSIYTRIREIFWVGLGMALVKIGNKQIMRVKE